MLSDLVDLLDLGSEDVPLVLFGGLTAAYLAGLWCWAALRRKASFAARHTGCAFATWAVVAAILATRPDLEPARRWAHGFADAGLLLIALSLAVGPLARVWRPASKAIPWRRELGVWGVLSSLVHIALVYDARLGWMDRLAWSFPSAQAAQGPAVHAGDVVGLVAAVYAVVLAGLSNDLAQKRLRRGWSWIMSRGTTLHLLVLLHAWIFTSLVYDVPGPAAFLVPATAAAVLGLQTAGFIHTVRGPASRRTRSVRSHKGSREGPSAGTRTPPVRGPPLPGPPASAQRSRADGSTVSVRGPSPKGLPTSPARSLAAHPRAAS